jgi:ribosomal protein L3
MAFSSVRANRGVAVAAKAPLARTTGRKQVLVEARAARAGVGLLGTKAGMTTIFQEDGTAVACTVIGFESSNYVTDIMTKDKNGYDAVQVCAAPLHSCPSHQPRIASWWCTHTFIHAHTVALYNLVTSGGSLLRERTDSDLVREAGPLLHMSLTISCASCPRTCHSCLQVGYKVVKEKNIKKPEQGHCKKAGTPLLRHLKEFKVKDAGQLDGYEVGKEIAVDSLFEQGQLVDVSGMTIGKGFQGTVKRWGHARGPMTHGEPSTASCSCRYFDSHTSGRTGAVARWC